MSESDTRQVVEYRATLVFRWRGVERAVQFRTAKAAQAGLAQMERIGENFAKAAAEHTRAEVDVELARLRERLAELNKACCSATDLCLQHMSRWTFGVAALLATHPDVSKDGDIAMKVVELH